MYSYSFHISSEGLRKVATLSKDVIRYDANLFTFLVNVFERKFPREMNENMIFEIKYKRKISQCNTDIILDYEFNSISPSQQEA